MIVKQKIFLGISLGFMVFMATAGLLLYWLRSYDLPALKSTILFLHGLAALAYLPVLGFHIYLGVFNKNTRQALRTMIKDVRLEYVIHNSVPHLLAHLNPTEGPLFIQGEVRFMSILSFQVKIPRGKWEAWIEVPQFKQVQLVHPALAIPVILPIRLQTVVSTKKFVIPTFEFDVSPQEAAKRILSRAIFFQKLFLEHRLTPRFSCHLQVRLQCGTQTLAGEIVDLSQGGMGLLMTSKVKKGQSLMTRIQVEPLTDELSLGGRIVLAKRIMPDLWVYGVTFLGMSPNDRERLKKVLKTISLNPLTSNRLSSHSV